MKVYKIMVDEYREACRDYYETYFGVKINTKYTIKNQHTGEVISGSTSGCYMDDETASSMKTIRRLMIKIFGNQVDEILEKIRKEERMKEKVFFKENPQFISYITAIR